MRGLLIALALAGCAAAPVPVAGPAAAPPPGAAGPARTFLAVVDRVEPVAEQVCRERAPEGLSCDFVIVVDDRPGVPVNAFQFRGPDGRPVVGMTLPLIAEARSRDELAFILGHEAAHHIAGHLERQRAGAAIGAGAGRQLALERGADAATTEELIRLGAFVGARRFGPPFELEADALGTVIAARAGYDPVAGAEFFARLPDPGDRFLGTHPPNAARLDTVRRVAAGLRTGS